MMKEEVYIADMVGKGKQEKSQSDLVPSFI